MINLFPAAEKHSEDDRAEKDVGGEAAFSHISRYMSDIFADCRGGEIENEAHEAGEMFDSEKYDVLRGRPEGVIEVVLQREFPEVSHTRLVTVSSALFQVTGDRAQAEGSHVVVHLGKEGIRCVPVSFW